MSGKGAGFWLSMIGMGLSIVGSVISGMASDQKMQETIQKEVAKAVALTSNEQ